MIRILGANVKKREGVRAKENGTGIPTSVLKLPRAPPP